MEKGDKVKMSKSLKKGMNENGSGAHIKEFGNCIGTIEEINEWGDAEVRWEPSKLRYAYPLTSLILTT